MNAFLSCAKINGFFDERFVSYFRVRRYGFQKVRDSNWGFFPAIAAYNGKPCSKGVPS